MYFTYVSNFGNVEPSCKMSPPKLVKYRRSFVVALKVWHPTTNNVLVGKSDLLSIVTFFLVDINRL